jgi:hypothetical protein
VPDVTPESSSDLEPEFGSDLDFDLEPGSPAEPAPEPTAAAAPSTITPERIAKAKRIKWTLIILIILLVAAIGALAYLGYELLFDTPAATTTVTAPTNNISTSDLDDSRVPGPVKPATTSIPEMRTLFGLTIPEAQAKLGPDFQLTKTETVDDPANAAIKQLATLSYEPQMDDMGQQPAVVEDSHGSPGAANKTETIYASLDAEGKILEIYYLCALDLLGYPNSSFAQLTATEETVLGALQAAGITPIDFVYTAPQPQDYTVYSEADAAPTANEAAADESEPATPDATAQERRVAKESFTFSGASDAIVAPKSWILTLTYDYSASYNALGEGQAVTRTLSLKLA